MLKCRTSSILDGEKIALWRYEIRRDFLSFSTI